MDYEDPRNTHSWRQSHRDQTDVTEPPRNRGIAPGKLTRSMHLPPQASESMPPVQRKSPVHASVQDRRASRPADTPVDDWTNAVFRPDLYQEPIQRQSMDEVGTFAPPRSSAGATTGGGTSLPEPVQAKMEHAFGTDFSSVRIHEDAGANEIGALAYTQGRDIHFSPGAYDPHSQQGQELIGHELTHVVQQAQGRVQPTSQAKGTGPGAAPAQSAGGASYALNDDPALEREADALGAKAARGQRVTSALPGASTLEPAGIVQRKAIDLVNAVALDAMPIQMKGVAVDVLATSAANFTWSYMQSLISSYDIKGQVADLLEKACLYLVGYGVRIAGLQDYLLAMNPYIEVLRGIKTVIESIPEPIRVTLMYGIGWGMRKFSNNCMGGAIHEKHINVLLIEGANCATTLGKVIDFLYNLGHNPTQALYDGIWTAVKAAGLTTASSFRGLLSAEVEVDETGTQTENRSDNTSGSNDVARSDTKPNLVDANMGFFWLQADQPQIKRWQDAKDHTERGGLELGARFGVKVFGNVMGADAVKVRVPYTGDWEMAFFNVSLLSQPVGLAGVFTGGPIRLQKVRITHEGLRFLYLVVDDFKFGDDVFTAKQLTMAYRAGDSALMFRGDTSLQILGHTINGKFGLDVGTDGGFRGGQVDLQSPNRFEIIKDRLVLQNPEFFAAWKQNQSRVGVAGDLKLNLLDKLEFAAQGTEIHYDSAKGFQGQVGLVWLDVPVGKDAKVRVEIHQGLIDRNGFAAQKVALIYAYGDANAQEETQAEQRPEHGSELSKNDMSRLMPGLNMDWIKATGLETLVVNLSATNVTLGRSGFNMAEIKKDIAKFKASLFGVGAEFDSAAKRGGLRGQWRYQVPSMPSISFDFPVVPGLNAGVGISSDLAFGASLAGTLTKLEPDQSTPHIHPWQLGNKVRVNADAGVQVDFDVSVGSPLVMSLHAGLFARAEANLGADVGLQGIVHWNDQAHTLELSKESGQEPRAEYDLHAALKAAIGAQIRARLFYVFDKKLWQYRFKEWNIGTWRAKGRLLAKENGTYEFSHDQTGFDGGKPSSGPEIEYEVVSAAEVISGLKDANKKVTSSEQLFRLVHDLQDPGSHLPIERRRELFTQLRDVNGTGQDIDALAEDVLGFAKQRMDYDANEFSLLMTKAEWIQYSTTTSSLGGTTKRKDVTKIDDQLEAYHKAATVPAKQELLDRLIGEIIPEYMSKSGKSRYEMAARLRRDAERERARISEAAASS